MLISSKYILPILELINFVIKFASVVFPEPELPTSATLSPALILRDIFFKALSLEFGYE